MEPKDVPVNEALNELDNNDEGDITEYTEDERIVDPKTFIENNVLQ